MRQSLTSFAVLPLVALLAAGCANVADSVQRGVERGAQTAAQREAARQADRAVTGAMRGFENAVICIVTDQRCIEEAQRSGRPVIVRDERGEEVRRIPAPGGDADVNPDFVAGNRVLFYDDYSSDAIGRFPSRLEFVNGSWEIAEWSGRRLLRNTGPRGSAFRIVLPDDLPERFTIEFDVYFPHPNQRMVLMTQPPAGNWNQVDYNYFWIAGRIGMGLEARNGSGLPTATNPDDRVNQHLVPIRIQVEGEYVRTYVGANRTANVPNAVLPRSEALHFENTYFATEEEPMYLGPIRIATFE